MTIRSIGGLRCQPDEVGMLRAGVRKFGFASLERALDGSLLALLRAEARRELEAALSAEGNEDTPYRARIGKLGAVARDLLASDEVAALLKSVFDERLAVAADASCFTYYRTGDFLSLHRDRPESCLATMIIYIEAARPPGDVTGSGLVLQVYGRAHPAGAPPRLSIRTAAGTLVVGRGSEFWHQRPPLGADEFVAALTACFFRPAPAASRAPDDSGRA